MKDEILNWLLEDSNPEVKLRTLKEYLGLGDDNPRVINAKEVLLQSQVYARALKKLKADKPWGKFDALMAFAEWGLTRADIGKDIDQEVFGLIEATGFKMLCAEGFLLRDLVKMGYYNEPVIKNEIDKVLKGIKDDGGFGCISSNKKINNPKKPHKSCARITVEYLLLVAELHLQGVETECREALIHYFTKRNIFYRTDDMVTPMVDVMTETFYPADPIKVGAHNIVYALKVLGCPTDSTAMKAGYEVVDKYRLDDGTYVLSGSKSVPAFNPGVIGKSNKWITLYAYMAKQINGGCL